MVDQKFTFKKIKSDKEIHEIYNFNVTAFADSHDFAWTSENIKNELENGWTLFALKAEQDIVCAMFVKQEEDKLLTKNTPIKMNYQGQGHSHSIKDFYEDLAKDSGLKFVYNYCPADNFRMISLNEGHGYTKTGNKIEGDQQLVEWIKELI